MNWEQSKQAAEQLWRQLKDTYGVDDAEKIVKALHRQVRPKCKLSNKEVADVITSHLFAYREFSSGDVIESASRLVMEFPTTKLNGPGYSPDGARHLILKILNQK